MRLVAFLCVAFLCAACAAAEPATAPVATVSELALYSAFWPNLHHTLYATASSRLPPGKSHAGTLPEQLEAPLSPKERDAWEAAVGYYERTWAGRDLLFDDALRPINGALTAANETLSNVDLPKDTRTALIRAAPIYRKYWWDLHDRANRAWIADVGPRLELIGPTVTTRLSQLMLTPWFTQAIRVDIVRVANLQGAYTSLNPVHVTISSGNPKSQQWSAVEILFHESSHALIKPIQEQIGNVSHQEGKETRDLWHVVLFYTVGTVMQQALEARGISYTPYVYATGLFQRAWPQFQKPIEKEWKPYIQGESTVDNAVKHLVEAI